MKPIDVSTKRLKPLFRVGGLLLGMTCLSLASAAPIQVAPEILTSQSMAASDAWDYRLDGTGHLWLAYYDQNRLLRLRDPDGKERLLVPEGRGQAPSGLAMASLETGVGLLWRDKLPAKGLFLLDTEQPTLQPLELGGETEPLARFCASTTKDNLLHLLWYGEKSSVSTGEQHNLYYRNWNRSSQAFSPIELLMPGIYPVMSTDDSGGVMVYSWTGTDKAMRIDARYRPADPDVDAEKGSFGDAVTVASVPEITPIFKSFRSGSRWFVIWLAQYGEDRRDFLLEGAHSDDKGLTWKRFSFEDLRGIDIGSLDIAAEEAGHLILALSGRTRQDDANTKEDVYMITSSDRGDTWSTAQRVRNKIGQDQENTDTQSTALSGFNARNPSVAFGQTPGQVLLAWEDWRDIRARLYASLSNDYGQTWTLSNVPLPHEPGKNLRLRYEPSAIYATGERFHLIAEQLLDDSFEAKQLIRIDFTADELADYAKFAQSTQELEAKTRQEILRKRVEGYWQAMLAADYAKTYEYLDPFFRARVTLQNYLTKMGKIKYTQAQVDDAPIDGARSVVTSKIKASVPPFKVPSTGEIISQPDREVAVKSTWLWLDGDWYREFSYEGQDIGFTRY